MRVLIFEDNLMWSARLAQSVRGLGHEALVIGAMPAELPPADVAIVNLGSDRLPASDLVPRLRALGVRTIGHAGHKEKPLLESGRESGCDEVVSNSTITHKLGDVLSRLA